MKKMKKLFAALIASVVLMGTAAAVTPSDIFLNYGGGINEGDSTASLTAAFPWDLVTSNGVKLPTIVGEYEYALPIGPVPFTFGGYAGATGAWGDGYGFFGLTVGASAKYHIACPPVPGLDFFLGGKLGVAINIGSVPDGRYVGFDGGIDVGCSYWFNDAFGITGSIGYPAARIGATFKF